jgi:hypothetical protein
LAIASPFSADFPEHPPWVAWQKSASKDVMAITAPGWDFGEGLDDM